MHLSLGPVTNLTLCCCDAHLILNLLEDYVVLFMVMYSYAIYKSFPKVLNFEKESLNLHV